MEKRFIYADNAATTCVSQKVLDAMLPYFTTAYGNPSSIYKLGRDAQRDVEAARVKVAKAIGADPNEKFFTSCGISSLNSSFILNITICLIINRSSSLSSLYHLFDYRL